MGSGRVSHLLPGTYTPEILKSLGLIGKEERDEMWNQGHAGLSWMLPPSK